MMQSKLRCIEKRMMVKMVNSKMAYRNMRLFKMEGMGGMGGIDDFNFRAAVFTFDPTEDREDFNFDNIIYYIYNSKKSYKNTPSLPSVV